MYQIATTLFIHLQSDKSIFVLITGKWKKSGSPATFFEALWYTTDELTEKLWSLLELHIST